MIDIQTCLQRANQPIPNGSELDLIDFIPAASMTSLIEPLPNYWHQLSESEIMSFIEHNCKSTMSAVGAWQVIINKAQFLLTDSAFNINDID